MRIGERAALYAGLVIAVVTAVGATVSANSRLDEPPTVRLATVDIYRIADRLVASDRFAPLIEEEQKRLQETATPARDELQALAAKIQGMKEDDPARSQALQEYTAKAQQATQLIAKLEAEYQKFVSAKYLEAYEQARQSADAVAEDLGFNYLLAARNEPIKEGATGAEVIQAVLARPVLKQPEGTDITEDVIKDLKLD